LLPEDPWSEYFVLPHFWTQQDKPTGIKNQRPFEEQPISIKVQSIPKPNEPNDILRSHHPNACDPWASTLSQVFGRFP